MRILVAEDERDFNRLICKTLERAGYSVDACFDGEEALDYTAGAEYDCILLDIMMPSRTATLCCRPCGLRAAPRQSFS